MHSHRYIKAHWEKYYQNKVDEKTRLDMTLHLAQCNECLDLYTLCVEADLSLAPSRIQQNVMGDIKKLNNPKQIMFAYITAACIALGFYSFGIFDKTIEHVPNGVDQSLSAIATVTNNLNEITNNFIWRDSSVKEK